MASGICLTTERLALRDPVEADRQAFVELFRDPAFMVYTADPCTERSANDRFDRMLANVDASPFSKRPIVELSSDRILGYIGVAPFTFEDRLRLEFGYRLAPQGRGRGYATEAGRALLEHAALAWTGTLMAMIDQANSASINVIEKLGFTFWKNAEIGGRLDKLYQLDVP